MNNATIGSFCPLYKEAIESKPWNNALDDAHRGLLFDKLASAWRKKNGVYEFDKGEGNKKDDAGTWLKHMCSSIKKNGLLKEALQRQKSLTEAAGGIVLTLKNTSRFITGFGREHPLENGFAWHHTFGVPYLPGSSLKGILRAWYREENGELTKNGKWKEDAQTKELFGAQDAIGQFVMLDMLPTEPPQLAVDVMTPHYGPYYQDDNGKTAPGDWHNPVPISFLAVEEDQSWQLAILPGMRNGKTPDEKPENKLKELQSKLIEALECLGAGAKTGVGYGRFEYNDKTAQNDNADEHIDPVDPEQRELEQVIDKLKTGSKKLAGDTQINLAYNKYLKDAHSIYDLQKEFAKLLLEKIYNKPKRTDSKARRKHLRSLLNC